MASSIDNKTSINIAAGQIQRQQLSQRQRQSLHILQLSGLELESYMAQAMTANPLLEVVESTAADTADSGAELPDYDSPEETSDENDYEQLSSGPADEWLDTLPIPENSYLPENVNDFQQYTSSAAPDFRDILTRELNLTKLPPGVRRDICEEIIVLLEDNGYLRTPLADIAMNINASPDEVESALKLIQSFDPPGIGARSLQECWLLQLRRSGGLTPEFERLLTELVPDLENNRPDNAAAKLHITMPELAEMLRKLRHLNSTPVYVESKNRIVVPDVIISRDPDGLFRASLSGSIRSYRVLREAEGISAKDAGADFNAKLREAADLVDALEYRKSSILRLAEMIIEVQHDFLLHGPEKLHPFTMKQAMPYLGVESESSVSRTAAEKYVETPHGIFPFKYFFSAGYVDSNGETVSRKADMELLKQLVESEDKHHPYSDEQLSQMLRDAGHPVARRTVVKYRELMKIPKSNLRKEHF